MKARSAFLALVATVLLTGSVWAQHDPHPSATQPSADSQAAPSEDMMTACHHHMSEAKETLATLDTAVTDAQQANTPAKKQAALDEVRSLVDQLKKHISMCPMMQSDSMHDMDDIKCMGSEKQKDSKKN
jgi:small-conductance mechanosensitive channel